MPTISSCERSSASKAGSRSNSSASLPSTMAACRHSGPRSMATAMQPTRAVRGRRSASDRILRWGSRATAFGRWAEGLAAPRDADEAEARIAATIRYWRAWLGGARIPDHHYRIPIERSALAIKGLTFMPTGAAVAALTTSLPETPGRRAQLGLPLHVDARRDLYAPGAPLAQP